MNLEAAEWLEHAKDRGLVDLCFEVVSLHLEHWEDLVMFLEQLGIASVIEAGEILQELEFHVEIVEFLPNLALFGF